jgi:hypothetical protein
VSGIHFQLHHIHTECLLTREHPLLIPVRTTYRLHSSSEVVEVRMFVANLLDAQRAQTPGPLRLAISPLPRILSPQVEVQHNDSNATNRRSPKCKAVSAVIMRRVCIDLSSNDREALTADGNQCQSSRPTKSQSQSWSHQSPEKRTYFFVKPGVLLLSQIWAMMTVG